MISYYFRYILSEMFESVQRNILSNILYVLMIIKINNESIFFKLLKFYFLKKNIYHMNVRKYSAPMELTNPFIFLFYRYFAPTELINSQHFNKIFCFLKTGTLLPHEKQDSLYAIRDYRNGDH